MVYLQAQRCRDDTKSFIMEESAYPEVKVSIERIAVWFFKLLQLFQNTWDIINIRVIYIRSRKNEMMTL